MAPTARGDRIVIDPTGPLHGEVRISGAKNSALKLMAATVVAPGRHVLRNVPRISDVDWMAEVLRSLGVEVAWEGDELVLDTSGDVLARAPVELVERMRASTALLGPLLSRCGEAHMALPGGDDFGGRPIDLHLQSLEALGATFDLDDGVVVGHAPRLRGTRIDLEYPSVGATENLMLAAVRAEGRTVIDNAAREPEIADLASFLNRMGAKVLGAGSPTITVEGVDELRPVEHPVVADRIEAATYLCALGAAGGEIRLIGARDDHMTTLIRQLGLIGVRVAPDRDGLWAMRREPLRAASVATLPYPGLPTDVLPMMVALLSVAEGTSYATENLFSGRFRYVAELREMKARIEVEGHHMVIEGVERLTGADVTAADIRAGAALVVAALAAEGPTTIGQAGHLDRGYDDLDGKLSALGVKVGRKG